MKVLVFDTETTGLPKNIKDTPTSKNAHDWPYIVQISYLIYDMDKDKECITTVVDHIIKIPEDIMISEVVAEIHGITNEISKTKGDFIEYVLYKLMCEFKDVDLIVAHNMQFDKNMLIVELHRAIIRNNTQEYTRKFVEFLGEQEQQGNKYFCTMVNSTALCNIVAYAKATNRRFVKYPSLAELYGYLFGYTPKNLHNSLNDVIVCFRCFYKLTTGKDVYNENECIKLMIDRLMP